MTTVALVFALASLRMNDTSKSESLETIPFEASKYGVKARIPKDWKIELREREDRVFVALIAQKDPERPGVVACELGLAPESLDEYRTRIDGNAASNRRPGGKLARNEVVKTPKGERLVTLWEFRPAGLGVWRELTIRLTAHRQLYAFTLNVDDSTYEKSRAAFDAMLDSLELTPPNTGADSIGKNRWRQREFRFAMELPESWQPVLAPSELALFYANGPASGIWSDNVLVLASPSRPLDLKKLAETFPDRLREAEPDCEVLACEIVKQGKFEALETVVRTRRGPFSMTVLERRFHGTRFDYEVKFTLESKRFDKLAPALRKSLDSFEEMPGAVPKGVPGRSA